MAKIAAIDIGTNSTRLLITSFIHNKISTLKREMVITRLGKNIESANSMQEDGIKKTIEALSGYLELCRQHKVEKIRAVGTSVFRRAGNRKYFLKRAYEKTGLKIDIISGQEEAKLCFEGVVKSLQYLDKTVSKIKYSFLRSKKDT